MKNLRFTVISFLAAALVMVTPLSLGQAAEVYENDGMEEAQLEVPAEEVSPEMEADIPSGGMPYEDETALSEPEPEPEASAGPEEIPEPAPSSSPAETPETNCDGTGTEADPIVCTTINGGSKTVVTTWSETTVNNANPPNVYTNTKSGTITEEFTQNEDGSWRLISKSGSRQEDDKLDWSTPNEVFKGTHFKDFSLTWEIGELGEIISSAETLVFESDTDKKNVLLNGKWVTVWDKDLSADSFEEGEPLWTGYEKEWIYASAVPSRKETTYTQGNVSLYAEEDTTGDGVPDIWTRDNDGDGTIDDSGPYGSNIT
jgi:hypothetical protein